MAVVLLTAGLSSAGTTEQEWDQLCKYPQDSVEMKNLRIWLAQEHDSACTFEVVIVDSTDSLVRHFLDMDLRSGYFNLYWDKKDDSGRFVPPGNYRYKTNECGGNREGKLLVKYEKWETTSYLDVDDWTETNIIKYGLTEDSGRVKLEICDRRAVPMFTPVKDSIMPAGDYECLFRPNKFVNQKSFIIKLHVDDYLHQAEVRRK